MNFLLQKSYVRSIRGRLKLLTRGIAALGIVIVAISIIAALWIQRERTVAITQERRSNKTGKK